MRKDILEKYGVDQKDFCVFGFEGNAFFTEKLKEIELSKQQVFKKLEIFTETVISHVGERLTFYIDDFNKNHHFFGSSLSSENSDANKGCNTNIFVLVMKSFKRKRLSKWMLSIFPNSFSHSKQQR